MLYQVGNSTAVVPAYVRQQVGRPGGGDQNHGPGRQRSVVGRDRVVYDTLGYQRNQNGDDGAGQRRPESAEEFFDLIWRLMRFDKHGPLDLILYHDNREEPRKWARNLIREMSADRLYERLLGWLADIQQPRPADCLRPLQIHALISEVLKTLPLDEDQDPPADWHFDLLGMSHAEAARSVKHLLEDVAKALLRCEDMAAYLSTSLFAFWAVDAAYSLDGRRNLVVKDCARRLLRHYTMLSLTCFQ